MKATIFKPTISQIQGIQRDLGRNAHCISGPNLDKLAELLLMFEIIDENIFNFALKKIFYFNLGETNGILHAYNPRIIEGFAINPADEMFSGCYIVFLAPNSSKRNILHEIAHACLGHKNWLINREDDARQEKEANDKVDGWLNQAGEQGIVITRLGNKK